MSKKTNKNPIFQKDDKDDATTTSKKNSSNCETCQKLSKELESLVLDNDSLKLQIEQLTDKNLRLLAKSQNDYKELEERQKSDLKLNIFHFVKKNIIPSMNIFYDVLSTNNNNIQMKEYLSGFEMVYSNLEKSLIETGFQKIKLIPGDPFDGKYHRVLTSNNPENLTEEKEIVRIIEKNSSSGLFF